MTWRKRPKTQGVGHRQGAALSAWEALQEARRAYAQAKPIGDALNSERERNHLEDLFRKALGGRR